MNKKFGMKEIREARKQLSEEEKYRKKEFFFNFFLVGVVFVTCISCAVFIECIESKKANTPPSEEKIISMEEFEAVQPSLYGEIILTEAEQLPLDLMELLTDAPSWSQADADFVLLDIPIGEDLQRYLHSLAHAFEIDYALLLAIIETESSFSPDIVSGSCYGLMQIHSINHAWLSSRLGIRDFLNPYENALAGVTVLRGLFDSYDTTEQVLMAYNYGESGARKLWQQNIFATSYTKKVAEKSLKYQLLLKEDKGESANESN